MTDRELMQMALDALNSFLELSDEDCGDSKCKECKDLRPARKAIEALSSRLAQPEPEPVAWYYAGSDVEWRSVALDADLDDKQKANCIPLYIAPPQREFVGLTDEEVDDVQYTVDCRLYRSFARAIEAKLKEKNT